MRILNIVLQRPGRHPFQLDADDADSGRADQARYPENSQLPTMALSTRFMSAPKRRSRPTGIS